MKRIVSEELLDSDSGTLSEVAASLRDLRDINRWLGGVRTTERMVEQVLPQPCRTISLLEVAAGSGDTARAVQTLLKLRGIDVDTTFLDRSPTHLRAGIQDQQLGQKLVVGDALALPFRDGSFDLVSCCLFVHHLSPSQVVAFATEALRVCRIALLINDLERHRMHWLAACIGAPFYRSRITRNDAPASVRQAYTQDEMRRMLAQSSATRVEVQPRYFFRMAATAWKA